MNEKKTILLVEDEVIIALNEEQRLRSRNYNVIHLTTGEKAVNEIIDNAENVDLILMDIDLGDGIDGTIAAQKILENYDIPILFLSSHMEEEIVAKTEEISSYGYVVKNSTITVLDASIKMALRLFKEKQTVKRHEKSLTAANEELEASNEELQTLNEQLEESQQEIIDNQIELSKKESFLNSIIEQSPYATWISDDKGTMIRANPALKNFLKLTDEQLIDKYNILEDDNILKQGFLDDVKSVFNEGKTISISLEWDGYKDASVDLLNSESIYVEATLFPIFGDTNNVTNVVCNWLDISKRKQKEDEVNNLRNFYETILHNVKDGLWVTDYNDSMIFFNVAMEKISGAKAKDVIGLNLINDFPPETTAHFLEFYNDAKKENVSKFYEAKIVTPAGRSTIQRGWLIPRIIKDRYHGMICTTQDVTESKRIEDELKVSEARYRSIVEDSFVGIAIVDNNAQIVYVNNECCTMSGFSIEELIGKDFSLLLTKESKVIALERYKKSQNNEPIDRHYDFSFHHKNGKMIYCEVQSAIFKDADGKVNSLLQILDVTKYKKTEEELRKSENQYRKLYNNTPIMMQSSNMNGEIASVNDYWLKIFGYNKEEVIGVSPTKFMHPESIETYKEKLPLLVETGELHDVEFQGVKRNGEVIDLIASSTMEYSKDNIPVKTFTYLYDVTQAKLIENELKDSEERFRALHNATFGGIAIHKKGIILDCNQGLSDVTGFSMEDLIALDGLKLIAPDWREFVMNKIVSGYENSYEAQGIRKDGSIYPLRLHGKNIPYKGEDVRVVEFRDITDLKAAEEKMKIANKEKDELFQELQHRAKNSFATISSLMGLKSNMLSTDEAKNAIHDLQLRVQALAELYSILYDSNKPDRIVLDRYCQRVVESVTAVSEDVNVKIDLCHAETDSKTASVIGLIIVELITNSMKHAFVDLTEAEISVSLKNIKDGLFLHVVDNGKGFDEKKVLVNGMGLTLVKSLVQQLDGELKIKARKGASFEIRFYNK